MATKKSSVTNKNTANTELDSVDTVTTTREGTTVASPYTRNRTLLWVSIGLLVLVIALYLLGFIKKGFAIGLGIILLAAIGIQTFNWDLDLGTLWKTGDINASRVQTINTKDGKITLTGNCVLPGKDGKGDLNCDNFKTQEEAQAKYNQCAEQIAASNKLDSTKVRNLDIYGLDGNKNGIVCEALPKVAPAM